MLAAAYSNASTSYLHTVRTCAHTVNRREKRFDGIEVRNYFVKFFNTLNTTVLVIINIFIINIIIDVFGQLKILRSVTLQRKSPI